MNILYRHIPQLVQNRTVKIHVMQGIAIYCCGLLGEKEADLSLGFDSDEDCVIGFQLYRLPCIYLYVLAFIFRNQRELG